MDSGLVGFDFEKYVSKGRTPLVRGGCVGGRGDLREVGGQVRCLRRVSGCLQQGVSRVLMKDRY